MTERFPALEHVTEETTLHALRAYNGTTDVYETFRAGKLHASKERMDYVVRELRAALAAAEKYAKTVHDVATYGTPFTEERRDAALKAVRDAFRRHVRDPTGRLLRLSDVKLCVGRVCNNLAGQPFQVFVQHEPVGDGSRRPRDPYAWDATSKDHDAFNAACADVLKQLPWAVDCGWESKNPATSYVWIKPALEE